MSMWIDSLKSLGGFALLIFLGYQVGAIIGGVVSGIGLVSLEFALSPAGEFIFVSLGVATTFMLYKKVIK